MFNIKLIPYIIIAIILSYGFYEWQSMKNTIEIQQNTIENKNIEISILNANIEINKEIALKEKQKAVFEAISKTKKISIEEKVEYDNSKSVDINSTRFYL